MNKRFSISGALGISLIAVLAGAWALLSGISILFSAVSSGGIDDVNPSDKLTSLIADHETTLVAYQEQFNGRSVFFKPKPPPRPYFPPPPPPVRQEEPKPVVPEPPRLPPPGPPSTYTGPSIIFAIGDLVRFMPANPGEDPLNIQVGEEKEGIHVISTNLPWSIRVAHKGGEYDVDYFDRVKEEKFYRTAPKAIDVIPGLIIVPPNDEEVPIPNTIGGSEIAAAILEPPVKTPRTADEILPDRARATARPRGNPREDYVPPRPAIDEDAMDELNFDEPEGDDFVDEDEILEDEELTDGDEVLEDDSVDEEASESPEDGENYSGEVPKTTTKG